MQTMYPGMINSPITELVADIDDTQTTIEVADGDALPDAPNLATIRASDVYDEHAETILYTTKTGNVLGGVTRGFQSAARSWSAGRKVARLFTAYDHNTTINNITALKTYTDERIGVVDDDIAAIEADINAQLAETVSKTAPLITDANSITNNGFYRFGANCLNVPETTAGNLLVYGLGIRSSQIASFYAFNRVYHRSKKNDTEWSPWYELITTNGGKMNGTLSFMGAGNRIDKTIGDNTTIIYFDTPETVTANSTIGIFRNTNTTGNKQLILYKGDASSAQSFRVNNGRIDCLNNLFIDITAGVGSPEGSVSAPMGSIFLRQDGGPTTSLYVKTSGAGGNTGWTAK